jgi:sugar lactone lactonase YvrE
LEIDPIAKTSSLLAQTSQPDGMICSPDGHTLYVAALNSGHVLGFDTTTKSQVFDSGPIVGGVDGIALGQGAFAGTMFVNLNAGSVIELNMSTLTQLVIASGGTRGDFVSVDPSNNTLLITQTDRVMRLNGANFVPEPGSFLLMGVGATCFLAFASRLRRQCFRANS